MSRTTVTAPLTPKFLDDKYGTHYSKYGVGGAQTGYASINEVYLIPVEKREALMIVSVINYGGEPALFWLKTTSSDPLVLADNTNWDIIPIGANLGGGVVYKGAFSPITGIIDGGTTPIVDPPTLSPPNSVNGEFYVANGSGTIDFGLGAQTFNNLDYAIFDGARWRLLPGSALASWNTLSDRPQILIDIGNGTIVPANQSDLTALDTRVGALESAQLTSTNSITVDSALVTTTTAVRAYSYSKGEVNTIVAGIGTGGQITAKYYSWLWSEGTVGGGGTYIDFVISTATEDGEIGSEVSSQLFVGKSLQTQNYSLQDTNFASDTIRIILSGSTPSPTTEVDFYYNNSGLAYPSSITAGNIVYDNAVSGLAATDVQAMGDELTILAAGHIHETIRYVDTVNGLDTNNGQYNSPYKTLTKALAERMLTENLNRAFKIKILNAAGDLGTVTFDGTGLGFVQTWIVGEGSINVTAATWIGTLNITNCGYYFYLENCPPLDINMTQTSTHWCKLGIQGGTPSGAITRTGNQNYTIIDLWNVRYSLTTQFTSIINVRFGATLNLSGTAGYFTRVNLYDGGVVAVNSQAFVVDWASFYGGIVEIGDGGSANIGNNDLSIFASTVEKHPNSSFTLGDTPTSPSVGVWSKYVSFEPDTSGIVATNVEDAIKEIYHTYTQTLYVDTINGDNGNNGQIGNPLLTLDAALSKRAEVANQGNDYIIYMYGSGDITSVTYNGNGVSGKTSIKGPSGDDGSDGNSPMMRITSLTVTDCTDWFEFDGLPVGNITFNTDGVAGKSYVRLKNCPDQNSGTLTFGVGTVGRCGLELVNSDYLLTGASWGGKIKVGRGGKLGNLATTVIGTLTVEDGGFVESWANRDMTITSLTLQTGGRLFIGDNSAFVVNTSASTFNPESVRIDGTGTISLPFGTTGIYPRADYLAYNQAAFGKWYVSTDGDNTTGDGSQQRPFKTIQHGIDTANSGDILVIAKGSYSGSLNTTKTITLQGEGDSALLDTAEMPKIIGNLTATSTSGIVITLIGIQVTTFSATIENTSTGVLVLYISNSIVVPSDGVICSDLDMNISKIIVEFNNDAIRVDNACKITNSDVICTFGTPVSLTGDLGTSGASFEFINTSLRNVDVVTDQAATVKFINSYCDGDITTDTGDITQFNSVLSGSITTNGSVIVDNQPDSPQLGAWYVDSSGSDTLGNGSPSKPFLTIQAALSVAAAKDTIYVGEGTYATAYTITQEVSIVGKGRTTTNITGAVTNTGVANTIVRYRDLSVNGATPITNSIYFYFDNCQVTTTAAGMSNCSVEMRNSTHNCIVGSVTAGQYNMYDGFFTTTTGSLTITGGTPTFINASVTIGGSGTLTATGLTMVAYNSLIKAPITASVVNADNTTLVGSHTISTLNINNQTGIIEQTVTLSQTQIQGLNTTPFSMIPAPGANKVIEIISCTVINNYNTAAFVTGTQVRLKDSGGSPRFQSSTSFITATAKRVEQLVPVAAAVPSLVNVILQIDADADSTGGNAASTIVVKTKYRIVNV